MKIYKLAFVFLMILSVLSFIAAQFDSDMRIVSLLICIITLLHTILTIIKFKQEYYD